MSRLEVVILAAGQGTRMKSNLPKVLHTLAEKPLLGHVIDRARSLSTDAIHVVIGHGSELVGEFLKQQSIDWVIQEQQLGTGHAVEQALPHVRDEAKVLILYGDVPLVSEETLRELIEACTEQSVALLTMRLQDPTGYGRIIRDTNGDVQRIVEQKDADEETLQIDEGNSGILAVHARRLKAWIERLENDNAQGEFYLTDIIAMAVEDGVPVTGVVTADPTEVMGINDRMQLANMERELQNRRSQQLMRSGVSLSDPARFDLRGTLKHGRDVRIDTNVIIEGEVFLGDNVTVGANCIIRDAILGSGVTIEPMSIIDGAEIADQCVIGPFARIRPGTELEAGAKVGNFVEIKKSRIGEGSKVNHLSYIGDTDMGAEVNIGAGTITCNYDGANKHRTEIGDRVFVGSDSQLVAPVRINSGATIGAGSTITRDAPADELTLSRSKQTTIKGWKRPQKERKG